MTREEAIQVLEYRRCLICQTCRYFHTPFVCEVCRERNCKGEKEALKMAIEALKAEPTKHGEPVKMMCNGEHIKCPAHKDYERGYKDGQAEAQMKAEPVKHGKWVYVKTLINGEKEYKCSECNAPLYCYGTPKQAHYEWCYSCGARMDEVEK